MHWYDIYLETEHEGEKMKKIQIPDKVAYLIKSLEDKGYEAYAVGGCVRDSLLGRIPGDWDITTSAAPRQVKENFPEPLIQGSSTER